jgi:hypothetical protein
MTEKRNATERNMIAQSALVFPWLAPKIPSTQTMPKVSKDFIAWQLSTINKPIPHQRHANPRHRQAVANFVHLCSDAGTKVTIPAVLHAPAHPRPLGGCA